MAPVQGRGFGMQREYKRALGAILAAAAWAATADITAAAPSNDRPLFVAIGATARPPIGWVEFCAEYTSECETKPLEARDVVLAPQAWKDLNRINKWVNDRISPMTDLDHWGVVERW